VEEAIIYKRLSVVQDEFMFKFPSLRVTLHLARDSENNLNVVRAAICKKKWKRFGPAETKLLVADSHPTLVHSESIEVFPSDELVAKLMLLGG